MADVPMMECNLGGYMRELRKVVKSLKDTRRKLDEAVEESLELIEDVRKILRESEKELDKDGET